MATHHLRNIAVEYVSLVDRSATRDPINKSQPRRFLLCKHEGGKPELSLAQLRALTRKDDQTMTVQLGRTAVPVTPSERAAAQAALRALGGVDEGRAGAAFAQLRSIAGQEVDPTTRSDGDLLSALIPRSAGSAAGEGETPLTKSQRDVLRCEEGRMRLRKADNLSPAERSWAEEELRREQRQHEPEAARQRRGEAEGGDIERLEKGLVAMLDAKRDLEKADSPHRETILKADDRIRELGRELQLRKSVGYRRLVEAGAA